MAQFESALVVGRDGLRGRMLPDQRDDGRVLIEFETGERALVSSQALIMREDGSYQLPIGRADLDAGTFAEGHDHLVIPVIEEQLLVEIRPVERGVRVHKRVEQREETVDEALVREQIDVERVPVNRVLEGPLDVRREGDTLIVPVVEEVLVVEKRLMLKEEVRITISRSTEQHHERVSLRAERVEIEPLDDDSASIDGKVSA